MTQANGNEQARELQRALEAKRAAMPPRPARISDAVPSVLASIPKTSRTSPSPDLASKAAEERRAVAMRAFLIRAKVPQRHRDFVGELSLEQKQTLDCITHAYAPGCPGEGMIALLAGNRGSGKTQIAVAAIREAARCGYESLYTTAMEIFFAVRACYRSESSSEQDVVQSFVKPFLLVIDEAHERGDTPWEDRILTYIIDKRYRDCKETIIISNLTVQEFAQALGPSIIDRVREAGRIFELTAKSYRRASPDKAVQP